MLNRVKKFAYQVQSSLLHWIIFWWNFVTEHATVSTKKWRVKVNQNNSKNIQSKNCIFRLHYLYIGLGGIRVLQRQNNNSPKCVQWLDVLSTTKLNVYYQRRRLHTTYFDLNLACAICESAFCFITSLLIGRRNFHCTLCLSIGQAWNINSTSGITELN